MNWAELWQQFAPSTAAGWTLAVVSISGINITLWTTVGLVRFLGEKILPSTKPMGGTVRIKVNAPAGIERRDVHIRRTGRHPFSWRWFVSLLFWPLTGLYRRPHSEYLMELPDLSGTTVVVERIPPTPRIQPEQVAVIIPAHNEEFSLSKTIGTLTHILPAANIYIGSDNSTDRTVEVAQYLGCQVADIKPNRGKAGVLSYLITHFNLLQKYQIVMIVDADVEVDPQYLCRALPLFDNPEIAAVAGHAASRWEPHLLPRWSMFFSAYRVRIYRVLQIFMKYGQTWRFTNMTAIVPGFASMYRTSALSHINITAPGMIIEDFNMTFELYHKRLGKVGYDPGAVGVTQDPFNWRDYLRQVKRWDLGFWQTVRRHGIWPSYFWASLAFFLLEIGFFSLILVGLPVIFVYFITHSFEPLLIPLFNSGWSVRLSALDVFFGIFAVDYFITIITAIIERKPSILFYGLGFIFLRYIDAFMFLYTLPLAFLSKSQGQWISPARR